MQEKGPPLQTPEQLGTQLPQKARTDPSLTDPKGQFVWDLLRSMQGDSSH